MLQKSYAVFKRTTYVFFPVGLCPLLKTRQAFTKKTEAAPFLRAGPSDRAYCQNLPQTRDLVRSPRETALLELSYRTVVKLSNATIL